MKIDVYSDILCPWCYIGKRRIDKALARLRDPRHVELVWRSYALIPDASTTPGLTVPQAMATWMPEDSVPSRVALITSTGAQEGLTINLQRTRQVSSFDAHRLLKLAAERGREELMLELLFRAHFTDNRVISSPEVLAALGDSAGLDGDEVRCVLAGSEYADRVHADYRRAAEIGVSTIPSIVIAAAPPFSAVRPVDELVTWFDKAQILSH